MSRVFDEKLSSHSAEKFCRGTRLCFRKFRVSKNCRHKKGISQISIENLLSHSTEDFSEGILCFWKTSGSEKFYGLKGGYHVFPSKFFGPTVPNNFVSIPSLFHKNLGIENFYESEREGVSRFSVEKFFVKEYRIFSLGNSSVFQKISCITNVYA